MGLYGERIGALNVVVKDRETAGKVLSQLKRMARAMYSNPPAHGAEIVAEILSDKDLYAVRTNRTLEPIGSIAPQSAPEISSV